MKGLNKRNRIDNRGFSLVELLIAVAIASIFGAAVFGFMTVGAKTFSSNSADVNLQNESQLAFNQIQDLVIDTAVAVEYYKDSVAVGNKVKTDSEIPEGHDKILRLINTDSAYDIIWKHDESERKLYYVEHTASIAGDHIEIGPGSAEYLMSENIIGFAVDLSRLESKRVVRVDLTYEKNGRKSSSSHNITLRNEVVSENKLEERTKTRITLSSNSIPDHIKGKGYYYAEPDEIVVLSGYQVCDASDNPLSDQPLRYEVISGNNDGGTDFVDMNGKLHVSPRETALQFKVRVYCQSDNSVKKDVFVRVVRTTGIAITYTPQKNGSNEITAKDELNNMSLSGNDIYKDDMLPNEEFTLTATPSISWTVSSDHTPYTLDGADTAKLNAIEASIKDNIRFKGDGMLGYPTLYKETGSLSDHPDCKFKMADKFDFEGTLIEKTYYTSPIRVRAYCGHTEDRLGSYGVEKYTDWDAAACKKKGDYSIVKKPGRLTRGVERNEEPYDFSSGDKAKLKRDPQHAEFVEMYLYEEGNDKPLDTSVWMKDSGGHDHLHWILPMSMDPTKRYTFKIISHWGDVTGTSVPGNAIYVLPYGGFTKDSDFLYTSDELTEVFDKLRLNYTNLGGVANIKTVTVPNLPEDKECDSNYVKYYVHPYENLVNSNKIYLPIGYNPSFYFGDDEANTDPRNSGNNMDTPKALTEWAQQKGGWYVYAYDEETKGWKTYNDPNGLIAHDRDPSNVFNWGKMFTYSNNNKTKKEIQLILRTDPTKWDKRIPSRIKLVPRFVYNDKSYEISDNYVETIFWNIKVPYNKKLSTKTFAQLLEMIKGTDYETCYFPGPDDTEGWNKVFVGARKKQNTGSNSNDIWEKTWSFAGFDSNAGYTMSNGSYELWYELEEFKNMEGRSDWKLRLYYKPVNSSKYVGIAEYKYNYATQIWDMESKIK